MALDKPSSWSTQGTLLMWESSLGLLGAIVQNADLMYYVSFSSSGLLRRIRWKRKISHMTRLCRCIIHQRSSNSHGHWEGRGLGDLQSLPRGLWSRRWGQAWEAPFWSPPRYHCCNPGLEALMLRFALTWFCILYLSQQEMMLFTCPPQYASYS